MVYPSEERLGSGKCAGMPLREDEMKELPTSKRYTNTRWPRELKTRMYVLHTLLVGWRGEGKSEEAVLQTKHREPRDQFLVRMLVDAFGNINLLALERLALRLCTPLSYTYGVSPNPLPCDGEV